MRKPKVLSIAGSDPSGGAGIQADLKTFQALGVYGMAAITALTAQNETEVRGVVAVPAAFVKDQIAAIFDDADVRAVKIGMLANAEIAEAVADTLEEYRAENIVLDPVMVATSGASLIDKDAVDVIKTRLIPMATLMTPNIPEAEKLMRKAVLDMEQAAQDLLKLGAKAALLKGGHLKGNIMRDVLAQESGVITLEAPRVENASTHGTGCRLSSAIAAYLGLEETLEEACAKAKAYLTSELKTSK